MGIGIIKPVFFDFCIDHQPSLCIIKTNKEVRMKNVIVNILKTIFPKSCSAIEASGFNKGYAKSRTDSVKGKERLRDAVFEANHPIGDFIIAVPNEHQNMVIGQIIDHDTISKAKCPVAWVRDYVTGQDVMLWQKAYPYSESLAKAVADLDPFNRHVLFYGTEKKFATVDEDTIIGWDKMKERLESNDFFNALRKRREGHIED